MRSSEAAERGVRAYCRAAGRQARNAGRDTGPPDNYTERQRRWWYEGFNERKS